MAGFLGSILTGLTLLRFATSQSNWQIGSANVFGAEPWHWNIHEGSCGYGYIWPDIQTGWDVASIPDARADFRNSCGRCYEVACHPSNFIDGFENILNRETACYDPSRTVVVKTTDSCPCNHPGTLFQYKRWCCGDTGHILLSVWAFEKLAPRKKGSIGLKYREVPCTYQPANPAPPARDPTPGSPPPPDAIRPAIDDQVSRLEATLGFFDGFKSGWFDKSYNVEKKEGQQSPTGGTAKCSRILSGGAVSMGVASRGFEDRVILEAWIYTQHGVPPVSVNVAGVKGACASVPLASLTPSTQEMGFSKYNIYLGTFDKALQSFRQVYAFASRFKGCAGNLASEVTDIVFKNDSDASIDFCIDGVSLH